MRKQEDWKYVIEPVNKRFELNFREIWQRRDLIYLFVKRDFISRYKQTILGPLWAIINPVFTTVVFTIVFGEFAKLPTMDTALSSNMKVPSFLFYMIGNVLWGLFSNIVKDTSNTFIKNSAIMGKVYYPRLVSPISSAISALLTFFIRGLFFAVLLFICIFNGMASVRVSAMLLMVPLLILQLMLLGLGAGLMVTAVTTKYRDMIMIVDFGLQLWLYATPVTYGLKLVPEKWLPLFMLNPVTPILTTMRYACLGEGYFRIQYFIQGWIITLLILFVGFFLFNRAEKNFVDTI